MTGVFEIVVYILHDSCYVAISRDRARILS